MAPIALIAIRTHRAINVDKNAAYPKAIAEFNAAGVIPASVELRQVKDLNNLMEQDHCVHQEIDEPWDGLLLLPDDLANAARF